MANRVKVCFDVLIDSDENPEDVLLVKDLESGKLSSVDWHPRAGGNEIPSAAALELERLWSQHTRHLVETTSPGEITDPTRFAEGALRTVHVNAYERSSVARRACITHWGAKCHVCGFDFESMYGERGVGFIEVHHLKPVSEVGEQYEVDPVRDLRPVCSNCHSMIHRREPMMTLEELQRQLRQQH